MDKRQLLNQKGLAEFLEVDRTTIRGWHLDNVNPGTEPPRILIGKRYYYDVEIIRRWMRESGR